MLTAQVPRSVSFSADNRQIVSGSRDKTIKLWNTLGECKFNIVDEGHSEWCVGRVRGSGPAVLMRDHHCRVSCVRFSPNPLNPVIVSSGWDKVVKVGACAICPPSHPPPPTPG